MKVTKLIVIIMVLLLVPLTGALAMDLEIDWTVPEGLDISEEVEIVAYFLSNRPAGQDEMDAYFNELAMKYLNCTLQSNWISFSEYATRYPLLFSSGESYDLVYTGSWLNFTEIASKGAFMALDDLFPTYAPNNYAQQSEIALQQATVAGHLYAIPTLTELYSPYGALYRTDILGDDFVWDGSLHNFEDIEAYLQYVKDNTDLQPLHVSSAGSRMDDVYMFNNGLTGIMPALNGFLWFDPAEDNPDVFTYYDYEGTDDFLEMMYRWNENGFFSKSALSDTDTNKLGNGVAAMTVDLYNSLEGMHISHPDWGIQMSIMAKNIGILPATQDACSVSITSKNPERALALYDLMTTVEEVYRAYYYGIEGISYVLHDVDGATQIEMINTNTYATTGFWCVHTSKFSIPPYGSPAEFQDLVAEVKETAANSDYYNRYMSFNFVTDDIQTEYAACQNVHKQYWWPLELGYTDPVEGLAEYKKNMEAAGIDKVLEEAQRQLDAYVANGYKNP